LFLCEASCAIGRDSDAGHLNPKDAAEIAARAGSKELVLTHYSGKDSEAEMINDARKSSFGGDIDVATDLSSYEV
jgi:ribonuclease BN (tRNA processing enzyme)